LIGTIDSGPRGEIVVGGPLVAKGYYELPDKTAESFYEENGVRWFRTGRFKNAMAGLWCYDF
jgi:acyl-CoA synthetase (AMP-forming)/AMP-acid ligase II